MWVFCLSIIVVSCFRVLMNSLLNTFAPSLDTISSQLERKYGVGVRLPLDRFINEYNAHDFSSYLRHTSSELYDARSTSTLIADSLIGESYSSFVIPQNTRSKVWHWFTSGGRFLSRMPLLRRNIDESVLHRASLVTGDARQPSAAPHVAARLVATAPRHYSLTTTHQRHRQSNTFDGDTECIVGSIDPNS